MLTDSAPKTSSGLFGGYDRAVTAVMLGATGLTACVGAPAHADTGELTRREEGVEHLEERKVVAEADALDISKATMTASEIDEARAALWSAYVESGFGPTTTGAPIDVTTPAKDAATRARVDAVMKDLVKRIEDRMTVTAYDMAHHESVTFIEGAPGYKEISETELRKMVVDALKDVPIGALPGGDALASIVESLPNADHLDAESMSFNEIADALGDAQQAWFKEKFGPFLDEHKVEAIVVTAVAVGVARATSPEVASFLDDVLPGIRIWKDDGTIGSMRWSSKVEFEYRDEHVLPEIDLHGTARGRLGVVDLRADAKGTLSVEGDEHVGGRLGIGGRVGGDTWADLYGSIDEGGDAAATLTLGHRDPDAGLRITGRAHGDFSDTAAHGDADGRLRFVIDATKDLEFKGATGDFGLYGSYGVDTDGGHEEGRIGVMFRLKW